MKNYAKVGGKQERPAYRTPSRWLAKRSTQPILKIKFNQGKGKKFQP